MIEKIGLATPEPEVHLLTVAQQMGHINHTVKNKKTIHKEHLSAKIALWHALGPRPAMRSSWAPVNKTPPSSAHLGQAQSWLLPQSPIVIGQSSAEVGALKRPLQRLTGEVRLPED